MRSGQGHIGRVSLIAGAMAAVMTSIGIATAQAAHGAEPPFRTWRMTLARNVAHAELPWTHEPRLGFPARRPRDRFGVPMERCGRRLVYPTGMLSINGMKRLDAYVDRGDPRQLRQALAQASRLRRMAHRIANTWWLPHDCSYAPENQSAPWWNAMTQGLAISFFVRLHTITGAPVHLEAARSVARSLRKLDRGRGPWVSFVGSDRYLWLEHYPRFRPSHVLNAHLHAVFGLYELWTVTREPWVRQLVRGGITTMKAQVARFRRPGRLSLYDLVNRTAHGKYHAIHVWQLRFLARISRDPFFWRMADRFARDSRPPRYVPGRPKIQRRP